MYSATSYTSLPRDTPLEDIEDDFIVGDRVWVDGDKPAFVQFIGETKFTTGDLAGVVYDEPIGKHNGVVRGKEYFQCENNRGDFVRLHRLSRTPAPGFEQCLLHNSSSADGILEDDEFVRTRSHSDLNKDVIVRRSQYRSPDGRRQVSKTITSTTHSPIPHYALPRRPDRVYASRVAYVPPRTPSPSKRSSSRARSATPSGRVSREEYFQTNLRVGERVCVNSTQGTLTGMLRFLGETSFGSGQWAGVELDSPFGKNDGAVQGRRYFFCQRNHGLFVPAHKVDKEYPRTTTSVVTRITKTPDLYANSGDCPVHHHAPVTTTHKRTITRRVNYDHSANY